MNAISTTGLQDIKTFDQLLPWLSANLHWPMEEIEIAEETLFEDLTFEYEAKELGLKQEDVAHVREIRQLRPLVTNQPWGIFFVNFEDKKIPIGVLKRILGGLTIKKRQSANKAEQKAWSLHDLLFISASGKSGDRELSFLHFAEENGGKNKTVLKELGWDRQDTKLKLEYVESTLKSKLLWPEDIANADAWREQWSAAFTTTHGATIKTAKELTKRLAELASAIRKAAGEVLEFENKNGPLTKIYDNFKQTIFHNLTPADFADMYAQTICYGLLAASIQRRSGALVADDAALIAPLTQPFLKDLMETFLAVGGRKSKIDFNELGVNEVVELLQAADMDAVLRDFGNRNPHEDPVLHFYEHFLRDYDSIMREQRGVYYTPLPVVRFIVRSVDEILTREFGLADGLADITTWGEMAKKKSGIAIPDGVSPDAPFVQILDPATGTGTFLVEVIDQIEQKLKAKWRKAGKNDKEIMAMWNDYVPKHLLPRLNGFELMMAPYAIAHIKLGMKLHETGYHPKDSKGPRVRVYLTNTLEEPTGYTKQGLMLFITESLAMEAKGADEIKAKTPITVVIGNPPYSGHSINNRIQWIVEAVQDYRREFPDLQKPGQGKWLQDDYVKFIRYSEHRLVGSGIGVLGFITNHAYLDNPTFKGMRKKLTEDFSVIHAYDLHGNSKKKEIASDGGNDENVFAIQQGVAILLARRTKSAASTLYRGDLFGKIEFKKHYLGSHTFSAVHFGNVGIRPPQYIFELKDEEIDTEYQKFTSVPSIFSANGDPAPGIVTTHDEFAISWSAQEAKDKVHTLVKTKNEAEAREIFRLCTQNQWDYTKAKSYLSSTNNWEQQVTPLLYRPFDTRYTIFNSHVAVHRRERVMSHMFAGANLGIGTIRALDIKLGWQHVFVSDQIIQHHTVSLKEVNYLLPLFLYHQNHGKTEIAPNLDAIFAGRIADAVGMVYDSGIKIKQTSLPLPELQPVSPTQAAMPLADPNMGRGDLAKNFGPRDVFDYIYAVLHSPTYRSRYADFLKSDFPRVPIPGNGDLFRELVAIGRQLVALHLLDDRQTRQLSTPETRYIGKGEARVEKSYPKYENGKVMINSACWFEDVPPDVWNFHIGGYQVCEKWLGDRAATGGKKPSPGRVLSEADTLHYRRITIAIRETIRLMAEIDAVINAHGGWPGAFETSEKGEEEPNVASQM